MHVNTKLYQRKNMYGAYAFHEINGVLNNTLWRLIIITLWNPHSVINKL